MKVIKVRPILDHVIVQDIDFGEQVTKTGIILTTDDGKLHGIKPRWGKVYAVGPKQKDVVPGEWILIEHGRWTRGHDIEQEDGSYITLRRVDVEAIIASSEDKPSDVYYAGEI